MTGTIGLILRYVLILAAGWLASSGVALYDPGAGTVTIEIEHAANVAAGVASLAAAVVWRKIAKWTGGKT